VRLSDSSSECYESPLLKFCTFALRLIAGENLICIWSASREAEHISFAAVHGGCSGNVANPVLVDICHARRLTSPVSLVILDNATVLSNNEVEVEYCFLLPRGINPYIVYVQTFGDS
jgi:hypothetical protein